MRPYNQELEPERGEDEVQQGGEGGGGGRVVRVCNIMSWDRADAGPDVRERSSPSKTASGTGARAHELEKSTLNVSRDVPENISEVWTGIYA